MLIYEEPASEAGEHAASKLIVRAQKSEHAIVLIEITSKKIMWSNYGVRSSIYNRNHGKSRKKNMGAGL